ncbi:MAG: PilZ domain-containing protein [Alphaproteobacteria bacterium]|nr:PilZ domain-containing protein [Alphaproteobacteria bacterium]
MRWLKELFLGARQPAERRRHPRYQVSAPLRVTVGDTVVECRLEDVSVGGVRLVPPIAAEPGTSIVVHDPNSGLELAGVIVAHDPGGTRARFDSENAGIVISTWLRTANETDGR